MRAISLAEANKIIEGTFASAKKRKAHALAAIVLDAGGRVKAFQKQDGASLMRFAPNRSVTHAAHKIENNPLAMPSRICTAMTSLGERARPTSSSRTVFVHVFSAAIEHRRSISNVRVDVGGTLK